MGNKSLGFLIVALFVGVLTANVLGVVLGLVFDSLGLQFHCSTPLLVSLMEKGAPGGW